MTDTTDLAAWLTQIWDEEERLAKGRWTANPLAPPFEVHFSRMDEPGTVTISAPGSSLMHTMPTEEYQRAYLVPAPDKQVLARIAADRKILELHTFTHECPSEDNNCGWWTPGEPAVLSDDPDAVEPECPTLRLLATPYADRPGYREEWRQ